MKTQAYLYLSFHHNGEKEDEIHHENGPEDRNIEKREEGAQKAYDYCSCSIVPRDRHLFTKLCSKCGGIVIQDLMSVFQLYAMLCIFRQE